MLRSRLLAAVVLLIVVGLPLGVPLVEFALVLDGWRAWADWGRLTVLLFQTAELVGLTLLFTLPLGAVLAVLLFRTDLPGRRWLRAVVVMALFVPLPLYASAWQSLLGPGGWLRSAGMWVPWSTGIVPAAGIHALAALPWVIWLIGLGLLHIPREIDEDARLSAPPWRALVFSSLPRCRPVLIAAGLWVAVQTAGEITVTDMMQVRTFAEETYTQIVAMQAEGPTTEPRQILARAVTVALPPAVILAWLTATWLRSRIQSASTFLQSPASQNEMPLRKWRSPAAVFTLGLVGFYCLVPIASLVRIAGLGGSPESWSAERFWTAVRFVADTQVWLIVRSLLAATATGIAAAGLALWVCWLVRRRTLPATPMLWLVVAIWALPGPVVGLALREWIDHLLSMEERAGAFVVLRHVLYEGPSLLPAVWAAGLRTLPIAFAIIWPAMSQVPQAVLDEAAAGGASAIAELQHAVVPYCGRAFILAAVAVCALALGEISASKLVATPDGHTLAHDVFTRMHTGVKPDLAVMCLLLLGFVAALAVPVVVLARRRTPS